MHSKFVDPKVGDTVALISTHSRAPQRKTIERVTATQIVVAGSRYRQDTGREVGADRWSCTWVEPWTDKTDQRVADAAAAATRAATLKSLHARTMAAMAPLSPHGDTWTDAQVATMVEAVAAFEVAMAPFRR
jgi:hypothetical protein